MTHWTMNSDDGYTLLEMLAAVAIMAMISVPLTWGFQSGVSYWRTAHETAQEQQKMIQLRTRLQEWLSSAYPMDVNRIPGQQTYPFEGYSDELMFSAAVHPDPTQDSLYRILLRRNSDSVLQLGLLPDSLNLADRDNMQWFDLLDDVGQVRFGYLEGVDVSGAPIWVTEWRQKFGLPQAVRVTIEMSEASMTWEDIVAPISLNEWAFCAFDAVSRSCRTGETAG